MASRLIATRSILYLNFMYKGGDELPFYDKATVDAWVDAGSAKWVDDDHETVKEKAEDEILPPPAAPDTAEPQSDTAVPAKKSRTRKS